MTTPKIAAAPDEEPRKNSRQVNIPINLDNWRNYTPEAVEVLTWFHQHIISGGLSYKDCEDAIGYDRSTIFRVLKGNYLGAMDKVIQQIKSYRAITKKREQVKHADFVETPLTRLISAGLDYAMTNNSITLIVGESRMGKTETARWWQARNNHGRTVFVTAPAYGGLKALLAEIAEAVGINRNSRLTAMHRAILRSFNANRMLIIDEAHRLVPSDARVNASSIELLRDIHDRTRCGLALLSTARITDDLARTNYMYEQLLGRIGMPVRLPASLDAACILPIIRQFVAQPSQKMLSAMSEVANNRGRLGIMLETLKVASRMAVNKGIECDSETVLQALALRRQMMGEIDRSDRN